MGCGINTCRSLVSIRSHVQGITHIPFMILCNINPVFTEHVVKFNYLKSDSAVAFDSSNISFLQTVSLRIENEYGITAQIILNNVTNYE